MPLAGLVARAGDPLFRTLVTVHRGMLSPPRLWRCCGVQWDDADRTRASALRKQRVPVGTVVSGLPPRLSRLCSCLCSFLRSVPLCFHSGSRPSTLPVWAALAPREPLQEQQTGGCGRGCWAGGAGAREALACGLRCELRRGWGRGGRPGVHSSVCDCRLHTGLRCPWEVACCLSSWVCGPGRQPLWTRALACC